MTATSAQPAELATNGPRAPRRPWRGAGKLRPGLGALALAAVVAAGACSSVGGSGSSPQPSGSSATPPAPSSSAAPSPQAGAIQINGAGATFPYPLYSRWFYEYAFIDPSVKFNYQAIGSGGGIKQITARTVDFGASDAILTPEQLAAAPGLQMFPTVAGAVAVVYNLAALKDAPALTLDGTTIANIFLGRIKKWNDPAIAASNPGVNLPNQDIIVVHRSDGSGTTFIFTDYLSNVSPDWKSQVGNATSVQWPVGLGGKGNEGVAGTLSQNDGAIAYVELAYAIQNKLAVAKLKNAAGNVVEPSIETTQAAMADFGTQMPDTLARSIVNAPGANSWPIAGYTYLLIYMDQSDCVKGKKLVEFLNWALRDGSKFASDLEYVPLPDSVRSQVLDKANQITCNGQPLR